MLLPNERSSATAKLANMTRTISIPQICAHDDLRKRLVLSLENSYGEFAMWRSVSRDVKSGSNGETKLWLPGKC
jgi:hypothetical protein